MPTVEGRGKRVELAVSLVRAGRRAGEEEIGEITPQVIISFIHETLTGCQVLRSIGYIYEQSKDFPLQWGFYFSEINKDVNSCYEYILWCIDNSELWRKKGQIELVVTEAGCMGQGHLSRTEKVAVTAQGT